MNVLLLHWRNKINKSASIETHSDLKGKGHCYKYCYMVSRQLLRLVQLLDCYSYNYSLIALQCMRLPIQITHSFVKGMHVNNAYNMEFSLFIVLGDEFNTLHFTLHLAHVYKGKYLLFYALFCNHITD